MKKFSLLFSVLALVFTGFYSCDDDDDDDPVVITYEMVVHNRESGMFYAVDTATGAKTALGTITYFGYPLNDIRGITYDAANEVVYVSENSHSYDSKIPNPHSANGRIFSVDIETLEATLIAENIDNDWYSVPGMVMSNGKLLGTVYWDYYDFVDYSTGLVWFNPDGTIYDTLELMYDGEALYFSDGMAIEYGSNSNELLISYYDDIIVSDLNGNVSEIIELTLVGFPEGKASSPKIKSLARAQDGKLYAVNNFGDFGEINLVTKQYIHIATFDPNDQDWQALISIPDTIF